MRSRQNIQNLALVLAAAAFLTLGIAQSQANGPQDVSIETAALPVATVGQAYSTTLSVTGTKPNDEVRLTTGTLPTGLTLSTAGAFSGRPTTAGSTTFTVALVGASGDVRASRNYTLTVQTAASTTTTTASSSSTSSVSASSTVTIGPSTLASGRVGSAYSQTLSVSGPTPPYTVKVTQGALPGGLSLSGGGSLSGTPTTSGSFSFTVSAFTSGGTYVGFHDYSLSIASVPVTISPSTLASGRVGTAYSQTLSVSGPTPPYSVRVTQGALPGGLSLSGGGSLTGTPTASGSFAFTVSAFTAGGTYVGFRDYSVSIAAAAIADSPSTTTTTISPSSLPSATVGVAYAQTVSVSGPKGPYTVRVTQGSLPAGLSLSSSGSLSGKPTTSGSYAFTVSAYTSTGSYGAFRDYKLSVASGSTSGTSTTTGGTLWFGDDFENGIQSPWTESASSSQYSLVTGWTGKAVQLIATSTSGGSSGSQMTALWFGGNSPIAHAYSGQNSWYHLRVNFPSTYYPTTGNWNWVAEWHIDPTTQSSCSGAVSIALGVYTDYPVVTNGYGKNPRLALRLAGGSCSSPTIQTIQLPSNSLLKNHWYDLYFHFVWSTSSTTGLAEWIVDGSQKASLHFPTLYNRNGTASTSNFGFYNYRLAASFIAPIQYDHVRIGSTQSAVS